VNGASDVKVVCVCVCGGGGDSMTFAWAGSLALARVDDDPMSEDSPHVLDQMNMVTKVTKVNVPTKVRQQKGQLTVFGTQSFKCAETRVGLHV
jgi:hypothetical protein